MRIVGRDETAFRHALATLSQLVLQYGTRLPCLTIHDAPAFAVRGVMLDVSRDRIPTMAELHRVIGELAAWKINHLQLYVEHTLAYEGHETAWGGTSPLTFAELALIEARCKEVGITLAANQNCFGHLSGFLGKERYAQLAEIPPGVEWDFGGYCQRIGPFSLCPTDPAALALVSDLLGQLLPRLASSLVNIGCDETFDVGQGRSRDAVAASSRQSVYVGFVQKVCAIAKRYGKRPMFWADIALEHPECLRDLPADLIGLAWGYEPDARFADWCDFLTGSGHAAWVCPGTASWCSFTGRTSERQANLLAAAEQGRGHGATGYLITDWGDLGHRQQWPISLRGLADGAAAAWSGAMPDARAVSLHAFADRTLDVASWLDALGDADLPLRRIGGKQPGTPLRNQSALFNDLRRPWDEAWVGSVEDWQRVLASVTDLGSRIPAGVDGLVHDELRPVVRQATLCAKRAIARRRGDRPARSELAHEVHLLAAEHRALWLQRARPGGLDRSCAHYEAVAAELESLP